MTQVDFELVDGLLGVIRGLAVHETKGMNLPVRLGASFGQGDEKPFVIQVIAENRLTAVATVHDVVDSAGIFNAQRAGHELVLPRYRSCVNGKERSFCLQKSPLLGAG